jgi:hypothetical protein
MNVEEIKHTEGLIGQTQIEHVINFGAVVDKALNRTPFP